MFCQYISLRSSDYRLQKTALASDFSVIARPGGTLSVPKGRGNPTDY